MSIDRTDSHLQSFAGNIRAGAGHPNTFITSSDDTEVGDLFLDTTNSRLYVNTDGTTSGWKYGALATTTSSSSTSSSTSSSSSTSTSTSTSSSSSSSSSTTTP